MDLISRSRRIAEAQLECSSDQTSCQELDRVVNFDPGRPEEL
jgi:hypothetical protein